MLDGFMLLVMERDIFRNLVHGKCMLSMLPHPILCKPAKSDQSSHAVHVTFCSVTKPNVAVNASHC